MEILVSQMGLSNESKALSTPCVRSTDEEDGKLDAEDRAYYRSWTMRASYLSQDRCELQFAVKELSRRMQAEHQEHASPQTSAIPEGKSEMLGRVQQTGRTAIVDVFSDSDWAGCAKTRRSTPSSYVMLGGHLLVASATTQNVVATSSGEAEFYALTKSASTALGAVAMAADMSRSGTSEASPYPSLVGARGGGTP